MKALKKLKKDLYTHLHKMLALPLLDIDDIPKGLKDIKKGVQNITAGCAKGIKRKFNAMLRYIETYWIKQWAPKNITCHGEVHRTNNAIESYHMGLNKLFKKNPSPSLFLR